MSTYLDRLRAEHHELQVRCDKLDTFLTTEKFASLEPGLQSLLREQRSAMGHYLSILTQRLETETPAVAPENLGEPVEIGGHDLDRDGPIPFNH